MKLVHRQASGFIAWLLQLLHYKSLAFSLVIALLVSACSTAINEKPIDAKRVSDAIYTKSPTRQDFLAYLQKMGYEADKLPFKQWGLDELTLCAAFFHPALDLAKAEYQLAVIETKKAGLKQNPSISGELARSNQKNGDIRPWAYGLTVSLPIATNNKRELRVEKATLNAESKKMQLAETLWQIRQTLAQDYLQHQKLLAEIKLLTQNQTQQNHIVSMLQKRVDAGIASNTQLHQANLKKLEVAYLLKQKQADAALLAVKLAADVGLSETQFSSLPIENIAAETLIDKQKQLIDEAYQSKRLQSDALLNRIDVRRSLATYAAAETEIRLRAAQKIPDITLSPGFIFEFGDSVWSLGFSSLIRTLSQHQVLMTEAEQLRTIEGVKFELLQSNIIAQLEQAHTRYESANTTWQEAKHQLAEQENHAKKIQKQFDTGLIDHITLTQHQLNETTAKQQMIASMFNVLIAANQIEDTLQKPLSNDFTMPEVINE